MKKLWIVLFGCFAAGSVKADWLEAMRAYENQNYTVAKQHFSDLVPLGNEDAAFNLGAMYFNGEGVAADKTLAQAYFILAAELGRKDAVETVAQLQQQNDATQLAAVDQQLVLLKNTVRVWPKALDDDEKTAELPKPIKRIAPKYPIEAARAGQFGYVSMRFLVDEQGKVQAIDVVDAYPEKAFNRDAIRAVKNWQYEGTGKKHLLTVRLDFSLEGGIKIDKIDTLIAENQLWQGALLGSPQHQFMLGTILQLVDIQSGNTLSIDKKMPIDDKLDLSVFNPLSPVRVGFDGFIGHAVVRVADDGTIIEQFKADFAPESKLDSLIGLKLLGKLDTDVYRIVKNADQPAQKPRVSPSFKVPASFSARFWWDKAARNGSKEAQRIMAAYDKRWEQLLLQEQDAEVMAWVGTRMLLEGQREAGLALLDAAVAKQYEPAADLKKQLM